MSFSRPLRPGLHHQPALAHREPHPLARGAVPVHEGGRRLPGRGGGALEQLLQRRPHLQVRDQRAPQPGEEPRLHHAAGEGRDRRPVPHRGRARGPRWSRANPTSACTSSSTRSSARSTWTPAASRSSSAAGATTWARRRSRRTSLRASCASPAGSPACRCSTRCAARAPSSPRPPRYRSGARPGREPRLRLREARALQRGDVGPHARQRAQERDARPGRCRSSAPTSTAARSATRR